jgi:hypothetical protein
VETKPLFIDDSSSLLNPKAGNLGGGCALFVRVIMTQSTVAVP